MSPLTNDQLVGPMSPMSSMSSTCDSDSETATSSRWRCPNTPPNSIKSQGSDRDSDCDFDGCVLEHANSSDIYFHCRNTDLEFNAMEVLENAVFSTVCEVSDDDGEDIVRILDLVMTHESNTS